MLQPEEKRLDGQWNVVDGLMVGDAVCDRIMKLVTKHLERIGTDASGWDTLYRDPQDGRYWELVYLHSEMHGGGPPSLFQVEKNAVMAKYGLGQGR